MLQILGGIWADRFGGKVVLGFGVVWWSLATILTPLAAKIGLPYLLTMRAFMGIGEVVCCTCLYILYCITLLFIWGRVCMQHISPSYIGRIASLKGHNDDKLHIMSEPLLFK